MTLYPLLNTAIKTTLNNDHELEPAACETCARNHYSEYSNGASSLVSPSPIVTFCSVTVASRSPYS